jgi:YVTN family beta-propeller protein
MAPGATPRHRARKGEGRPGSARLVALAVAVVLVVAGAVLAKVQADRDESAASSAAAPTSAPPTGGDGESDATTTTTTPPATVRTTAGTTLTSIKRITGAITPKSVVASGHGITFAQNMIYTHTVTAYGPDGTLLGTIPDSVDLAAFGVTGYPAGPVQGGPVEVAFTPDGTKAYVSNYEMYGAGFAHPGDDVCNPSAGYDNSFVYRVDVKTLTVDQVIEVGPVPKYVAVSPDGRWVLVSNWCGYDVSVIDVATAKEVQRIPVGAYPRGIVVRPDSSVAYVAVMGSTVVKAIDLHDLSLSTFATVGSGPRHLVLSPDASRLYVTLNGEGTVAAVDTATGALVGKVRTGAAPRSMDISADGASLYVVNYESSTMSKVATADLSVQQELQTDAEPIGITYDRTTGIVWVACYGGSIELFQDGAAA